MVAFSSLYWPFGTAVQPGWPCPGVYSDGPQATGAVLPLQAWLAGHGLHRISEPTSKVGCDPGGHDPRGRQTPSTAYSVTAQTARQAPPLRTYGATQTSHRRDCASPQDAHRDGHEWQMWVLLLPNMPVGQSATHIEAL